MTNTSHTPGPWFIKKATKLSHIHGGNPECSSLVVAGVQDEANARLIATAPDLFKALQRIELTLADEQCITRIENARAYARAAIAKAKGE